jgi:hypothetical protein
MGETTQEKRHQAIWAALRGSVCAVCLDRNDEGSCGLSGGLACGLEAHLPRILEVVETVRSSRMDEYVAAIHQHVCVACVVCEQGAQGECRLRNDGACTLDAYLPLVVKAIAEAQRTLNERPT